MTNPALSQFDSLPTDELKKHIEKVIPANLFTNSCITSYGSPQLLPNYGARNKALNLAATMAIELMRENLDLKQLVYYPSKARFHNVGKHEIAELEKEGIRHYASEELPKGVLVWFYNVKSVEPEDKNENINELSTPHVPPTEALTLEEAIEKYNELAKVANLDPETNISFLSNPLNRAEFNFINFTEDIKLIKTSIERSYRNVTRPEYIEASIHYITTSLATLEKVEKIITEGYFKS